MNQSGGERLEMALPCGVSTVCGGICGGLVHRHAGSSVSSGPLYAIANARIGVERTLSRVRIGGGIQADIPDQGLQPDCVYRAESAEGPALRISELRRLP